MTHWFEVLLYELRQQFRRKAYRFVTFGVPLLALLAFFGYQAYHNSRQESDKPSNPLALTDSSQVIGYVDLTREGMFPAPDSYERQDCRVNVTTIAELTNEIIKRVSSPYCLRDTVHAYPTREAGEQALDDGSIDALYIIEPTYSQSGQVSLYMSGFNIEAASTDRVIEDYILASLLYHVDPDTFTRLYLRLRDPAVINEHVVTETGIAAKKNENQGFVMVYAFGLILMLSLFWGGGYLMQSVVQEKESRIIEIILSSVKPTALLAGKIFAMGLLSLIQVALLIGTFIFIISRAGNLIEALGKVEVDPLSLVLLAVYFVLGFLLFGSLMAAIGALSSSVRESQNFVVVVTLPASIPFFFLTMFVEEPNGSLARIMSIFPFTAPMSMVMRLAVTDVPAGEIALSLALLVLAVAFVIWFAGRLFRVNTLLRGNTPRFKDIPNLLRG